MARRHELADAQFAKLAPLPPPERPATGRPNHAHRTIVNDIRWRLKTGVPRRDLPKRYGKWETVYGRFRRWQRAGVWARALAALQADADARGDLDWGLHFVDGTTVRAHPHAAGAAPKDGPPANRPTTPSAAARAASPPGSTCGPRAAASRSAAP